MKRKRYWQASAVRGSARESGSRRCIRGSTADERTSGGSGSRVSTERRLFGRPALACDKQMQKRCRKKARRNANRRPAARTLHVITSSGPRTSRKKAKTSCNLKAKASQDQAQAVIRSSCPSAMSNFKLSPHPSGRGLVCHRTCQDEVKTTVDASDHPQSCVSGGRYPDNGTDDIIQLVLSAVMPSVQQALKSAVEHFGAAVEAQLEPIRGHIDQLVIEKPLDQSAARHEVESPSISAAASSPSARTIKRKMRRQKQRKKIAYSREALLHARSMV